DDGANIVRGDYRFVLQGPIPGKAGARQDELVLAIEFPGQLIELLTRNRAADLLARDGVHKKVMTGLAKEAANNFREQYLNQLVTKGNAIYGGHTVALSGMQSRRPLNTISDVVSHVKGELLDNAFGEKYPNYPIFTTMITVANLESEMTRALQSLDRIATQQLDLNSRGYLESFGAFKEGNFSASSSDACRLILERIDENDKVGKVTPLEDLLREFVQAPWGLEREMAYLLLGALLFNGYLIFVRHGGARLHAGDVGPMLKSGLKFFDDIRYLERDKDIDVEGVVALFTILGLQTGLVRDKDSRAEAVKALRAKGQELQEGLRNLQSGMQNVVAEAVNLPDIPWLALQQKLARSSWLKEPLADFASASKVSDLGKLDTTPEFRTNLKTCLENLSILADFLRDWRDEGLGAGLKRLLDAVAVLPNLDPLADPDGKNVLADLRRIAQDSKAIYSNEQQLLKADLRRPLKGKLEQFHQKYNQLYYGLHRRLVGDDAPWAQLDGLRQSVRFRSLNRLKSLPFISPAEFNQIALELQTFANRRCRDFNAQVFENSVTCPYCRFPENAAAISDLPGRVSRWSDRLDDLWNRWQEQVFDELPKLAGRLELLTVDQQKLIKDLLDKGELPDEISEKLLEALFELASELQPVELDVTDLAKALLAQSGALTVDNFRASLDTYVQNLLKGYDRRLVRIKIVLPDPNLGQAGDK
ncbi:MAG: hypothetical protein JXA42_13100, partial [Anaerolineales bacterium]|nr:hypothetical protein [Anaerolineales bacterium]